MIRLRHARWQDILLILLEMIAGCQVPSIIRKKGAPTTLVGLVSMGAMGLVIVLRRRLKRS